MRLNMEKRYTESHEWIALNGNIGTVGITKYAQEELGEIVYIELPEIERDVLKGEESAVLESTKAAADVYAPVSGKIIEINPLLVSSQEALHTSPEESSWLYKIALKDLSEFKELMEEDEYKKRVT
jgi:glycine cleavage system H protein